MRNSLVTVNMVVKNEDRFIYYSLESVLPYADKIIITDTGSSDSTIKIIKSFNSPKISLTSENITDRKQITSIRQTQIEKSQTDWIWIVDGDEVYTKKLTMEIKELISAKPDLEGIIVGRFDLLGDIYHHQSDLIGYHHLFGKKGHYVLRLLNKKNISGLHVEGKYPYEGYYDRDNKQIIFHQAEKFYFTQNKLWHAMYLKRSSLGGRLTDTYHRNKYKIESGKKFPSNETLPEVFFKKKNGEFGEIISKRSLWYELSSFLITPFKMIKRKLI